MCLLSRSQRNILNCGDITFLKMFSPNSPPSWFSFIAQFGITRKHCVLEENGRNSISLEYVTLCSILSTGEALVPRVAGLAEGMHVMGRGHGARSPTLCWRCSYP